VINSLLSYFSHLGPKYRPFQQKGKLICLKKEENMDKPGQRNLTVLGKDYFKVILHKACPLHF
jgi:hypothetical protein